MWMGGRFSAVRAVWATLPTPVESQSAVGLRQTGGTGAIWELMQAMTEQQNAEFTEAVSNYTAKFQLLDQPVQFPTQ